MSELGMASMGLEAGQTMLNMAGQAQVRKQNRAMRRLGDQQRVNQEAFNQNEMAEGQKDVNRNAYYDSQNALGNDSARGVLHSSIPMGEQGKLEDERKRRYDAIQRRRDFDKSSFQNQSDMIAHQRKAEDINNTISMMTSFLGGGANGAMQSYSGRTY